MNSEENRELFTIFIQKIDQLKPFTGYRFVECIDHFKNNKEIVDYLSRCENNAIIHDQQESLFTFRVFSQVWDIIIDHEHMNHLLKIFEDEVKMGIKHNKTQFVARCVSVLINFI